VKLLSIIRNGSTLFTFQILPNREYILTRPPQTSSKHVPIRVRQKTHKLIQLEIELGVGYHNLSGNLISSGEGLGIDVW